MSKAVLLVYTNCPAEKEAEFNEWYDKIHVPDILAVEGFIGARRFKLAGPGPQVQTPDGPKTAQYLAMYEMDTDDTRAAMKALGAAIPDLTARGRMFDGLALVSSATYVALGDRQTK